MYVAPFLQNKILSSTELGNTRCPTAFVACFRERKLQHRSNVVPVVHVVLLSTQCDRLFGNTANDRHVVQLRMNTLC